MKSEKDEIENSTIDKLVFKSVLYVAIGLISLVVLIIHLPNPNIIDQNDWIGFYGSIVGSLVGGYITYIGISLTLINSKKAREEDLRVHVRPYITADVSKSFIHDYLEGKSINRPYLGISFKNIGMNNCINIQSECHMYDSANSKIQEINLLFESNTLSKDEVSTKTAIEVGLEVCKYIVCTINFDDLEDRSYSQSIKLDIEYVVDQKGDNYNTIDSVKVISSKPNLVFSLH